MSRHRIVRRMNYEDECYDDDDDYGQSYEDRYCISPSTAAQFTYNREQNFDLSSYMEEEIPEEDEGGDREPEEAQAAAPKTGHEGLSDMDRGRLQSCLEEIHNVMGDSQGDGVLTEAILRNNFNIQATLNELLSQSEIPKPQRTPRKRKERAQGDDANIEDLLSEISALDEQDHLHFREGGGRFRFQKGLSPPAVVSGGGKNVSGEGMRRVKSPPSSVGSPSSACGGDVPLSPTVKEGIGRSAIHKAVGDGGSSSSSSSSPLQFASPTTACLETLIQQHRQSQQQRPGHGTLNAMILGSTGKHSSSGPQTVLSSAMKGEGSRGGGLSLNDLIKAQKSTEPEPTGQVSGNPSQAVGLSLSDYVRGQLSSEPKLPMQTSAFSSSPSQKGESPPQKGEGKPISGMSLSELIAQKRQPPTSTPPSVLPSSASSSLLSPALSSPSSSSLVMHSSSQSSKGLSLKELINLRSSQQQPNVSEGMKPSDTRVSDSKKSSSTTGLSLTELIKSHSKHKDKPVLEAGSRDISLGTTSNQSLSGQAVSGTACQNTRMGSSPLQPEGQQSSAGTLSGGGGLSLSELIKQRQNQGSKPQSSSRLNTSSQDLTANTTGSKAGSELADRLEQGLSLESEGSQLDRKKGMSDSISVPVPAVGDKEGTALSLADCLKKKMTLQPKHSQPEISAVENDSIDVDEDEDQTSPPEVVDFEADCFDPMKVDPAMRKPPSLFARCICVDIVEPFSMATAAKKRKSRFPKFKWTYQIRNQGVHVEVPLHKVARFDFETPSPDDIVKARQKAAFGQGGQHMPDKPA